jgi:uncharacterized membrane protein HdeD (DUF308 family)
MKKSSWIIFPVNGAIALLFGLMALFVEASDLLKVIKFFGFLLILGGAVLFYLSYRNMKTGKQYLLMMVEAIIAVLIGAIIAFYPGATLQIFLFLVGIWATILGLLQIFVAANMKKKVSNHSFFTYGGIVTLVFGILLFFYHSDASTILFKAIGILALAAGVMMIYLGVKVKGIKEG